MNPKIVLALSLCALTLVACTGSESETSVDHPTPADQETENEPGPEPTAVPADVVAAGDAEQVREILQGGADPNGVIPGEGPFVVVAAGNGHDEIVEMLLDGGAQIDATDADGNTALITSARAGRYSTVALLLERGADQYLRNTDGERAYDVARADDNSSLLDLFEPVPPIVAAARDGDSGGVKELLVAGADPNIDDQQRRPALYLATAGGDVETVKHLLDYGADPDAPSLHEGGELTALYEAVLQENAELVQLLMNAGADPDHVSYFAGRMPPDGFTPLEFAATRDNLGIQLLVEATPTPILAVRLDRPRLLETFAADNGNLEQTDRHGLTGLMWAVRIDEAELARRCIDLGADPNAAARRGRTPLIEAAAAGHPAMIALLVDAGADPDLPDDGGWTPITYAADAETAQALAEAGSDLRAVDERGADAVRWAWRDGRQDVVDYLRSVGAEPVAEVGPYEGEPVGIGITRSSAGIVEFSLTFTADGMVRRTQANPYTGRSIEYGEWERDGDTVTVTWYRRSGSRPAGREVSGGAGPSFARYEDYDYRQYVTEEFTLDELRELTEPQDEQR